MSKVYLMYRGAYAVSHLALLCRRLNNEYNRDNVDWTLHRVERCSPRAEMRLLWTVTRWKAWKFLDPLVQIRAPKGLQGWTM